MAGHIGWKIYFKNEELRLVYGKKVFTVDKKDRKLVIDYVNLNYQSMNDKDRIRKDFTDYLKGLLA